MPRRKLDFNGTSFHDEILPKPGRPKSRICRANDMAVKKLPKIVVIGGGTGAYSVLSGLKKYPVDLTAVISMADDGGSTGVLREEFGILPPGDIRRALIALSRSDDRVMANLFNYRFSQGGGLNGHSFGNLMLTALERVTGSFENAVNEAGRLLGVQGQVLPVTLANSRLCAELENGETIKGQTDIDIPKHDGRLRIKKIFLKPAVSINKKARDAILKADLVVLGPGDLYTSIIPNLIVRGVRKAINQTGAKKIYVVNIMTKFGETHGFKVGHFAEAIEKHIRPSPLDCVIVNTKRPTAQRLRRYEKEKAEFVEIDQESRKYHLVRGSFLRPHGFVRHDPSRLAHAIYSLL